MRKKIAIVLACAGFLVSTHGAAQANLIANGSFENAYTGNSSFQTLFSGSTIGTPGWTVTSGSVDWVFNYWPASDGTKSIDLAGTNSHGTISQSFGTTIGQTYRVQFDYAGNPDRSWEKRLTSDAGDTSLTVWFDQVSNGHTDMQWETVFFDFTAISTSTLLTFVDETVGTPVSYGAALDNVTVNPVPEPSTLLLLGAGLAGVGLFRRKSRRG